VIRKDKLLGRLLGVLSYAADGLEHLATYEQSWENDEQKLLRRRDKIAPEALLLAYLSARIAIQEPRLSAAITSVRDRAEAYIDTGRSEALLRRFPQKRKKKEKKIRRRIRVIDKFK